jgi:hypothetical protein
LGQYKNTQNINKMTKLRILSDTLSKLPCLQSHLDTPTLVNFPLKGGNGTQGLEELGDALPQASSPALLRLTFIHSLVLAFWGVSENVI